MDFKEIAKTVRKQLVKEHDDYRIQYCSADYIETMVKNFKLLGEILQQYYGDSTFGDVGSGLGLFKHANPDLDIFNWDMLKRDEFYNEMQVTEVQGWYGDYTKEDFHIYMDPIPKQDILVVSRAIEKSMFSDIETFKKVMKNVSRFCNDEIFIYQQHFPGRPKEVKSFLQHNSTLLVKNNSTENVLICSFAVDTINRW